MKTSRRKGRPFAYEALVLALLLGVSAWIAPPRAVGAGQPPAGPGKAVLGELSREYEPVKFDHAAHVGQASGCGDCHHQHGTEKGLSCKECHGLDDAAFRKAVGTSKFKSCKGCHAPARTAEVAAKPDLKSAYHRACFKCHRGDVGTVGTDPKGCVEMCHAKKDQTK